MKILLVASSIAILSSLSFVGGAVAADLYVEDTQMMEMASPSEWGFYAKAFGGLVGPGTINNGFADFETEMGPAAGLAVGIETPIEGLAFELDLFWTAAVLIENPDVTLTTLSAMADVVYTVDLNETFGVYGGAGLGFIHLQDELTGTSTDYGTQLGYQVMVGAVANLTPNFALTGELRWQDSFNRYNPTSSGALFDYGTASALVGIKVSTD